MSTPKRPARPVGETDTEEAFLARYDPSAYDRPSVTVDVVVLTIRNDELCALLITRGDHPFKGHLALPGGFLEPDEDADTAAARELAEETGTYAHLEQLRTYTAPGRDPRTRVLSLAYLALVPNAADPVAGTDATTARFVPLRALAETGVHLAFDHDQILTDAVERAAAKLEYTTIATAFCEPTFTIAQLRKVYETVWGYPLHPANFRRKVLSIDGFLTPVDAPKRTTAGRPAALYSAGTATALMPPLMRTHNRPPTEQEQTR
ncbi:NUDIX domain-containing protein [Rhodococcus sp. X156]|uniref:NUDIX hydrolase n=1 Tax=Rhodococcus sp. X156 TaxID=2499145 RepID=UPI000FDBF5C9|nr:NUDIX domain-containing protein [Rhodococcus sp. X156]